MPPPLPPPLPSTREDVRGKKRATTQDGQQGVKQATPVRQSCAAEDGVDSNDDETCEVLLKKCEEEAEKIRICLGAEDDGVVKWRKAAGLLEEYKAEAREEELLRLAGGGGGVGRVISPEEVDVRPLMALLEAAGPCHSLKFHAIEAEVSRKGGEEGSRLQTLVGQSPDISEVEGSNLPAMSVVDQGISRGQQQVEISNRLQRLKDVFNLCRARGDALKGALDELCEELRKFWALQRDRSQ
eukprot:jgi/Undpi1/4118/HiC_scaffold_16.g07485.m1